MNYCDFLALPYYKEISLRKISYQEDELKLISKKINKNLREWNKTIDDENPIYFENK